MSYEQRTIARRVSSTGVGLHSGEPVTLTLAPAAADSGITFVRMDLGIEIPARSENVADTTLSTNIGRAGARVSTVEHVLAALHGVGIDNCRVEVDGSEVPILDGSAAPFVCLVREAGVRVQKTGRRFLVMDKPVEVRDGDKVARLEPSSSFTVDFTADFDHPLITNQVFHTTIDDRTFEREIARARTFCFLKDIERMQAAGLAKGGSLANAIVVDDFSILNPDGLRFPDEFARHKVLDAVGDLAMLGMPVIGAMHAVKSGHAMNQALVRKVLADPATYRVVRMSEHSELPRPRVPALVPEEQIA